MIRPADLKATGGIGDRHNFDQLTAVVAMQVAGVSTHAFELALKHKLACLLL